MPTRSNKTGQSPAAQTTAKGKIKKGGNSAPPSPSILEADPPIIIQGGGSVTIYSQYPFDLTNKPGDKYPYVYYSRDASIAKMKMHGKGGDKDDDTDNGKFKIDLYK